MSEPYRVLFIGNSYTTRYEMPSLLKQLAARAGVMQAVETQVIASGGASLAAHWNKGEAPATLNREHWDAVVLQDQSTRALRALKSLQEYGRRFAQAAQATGATTFFYVTWARENDPESQAAISSAYQALARETGASLVPVGPAWQQVRRLNPNLALHDADRSHPTFAGSYLSACVFCASLFGKKAQGMDEKVMRLNEEEASLIHQVAWQVAGEPPAHF